MFVAGLIIELEPESQSIMLLDQRSVLSLAFPSCFERDELTAEAAEIDAARDMEVYLGFAKDTGRHIRRPHVSYAGYSGGEH